MYQIVLVPYHAQPLATYSSGQGHNSASVCLSVHQSRCNPVIRVWVISHTRAGQTHYNSTWLFITHNMKMCQAQHLAINFQGNSKTFYSNIVRSCYTQNFVSTNIGQMHYNFTWLHV